MKKFLAIGLAALLAIGATIVPDEFDKLFLRCNGTTTTFVDSSTANPKTITANGNATQIPVLEAGKPQAMFFNGTTDYVDIANSADFAFGVGAFEIEFSFMTNKAATAQTIIDNRTATADTDAWLVNIINSSGNKLCFTTATTARITGTTTLAINTKYRCKIVGNGGANGARTVIMYLAVGDGDYAQEGSTYTADYNFAKQTLRIGSVKATAGTYYNGWLKNLTLKKAGTTVLDMRGNTPATSPLGPAIAFDGTGDYLTVADHADWDFGTGDFTMEGWFNWTTLNNPHYLFQRKYGPSGNLCDLQYSSGALYLTLLNNNRVISTFTPTLNVWYHIAAVRSGTNAYIFINGVQIGSTGTSSDNVVETTALNIGSTYVPNYYFAGSMREIRVSNIARYTSAFTPSQTGFTVDANTKLYIKGNEDNGVTTFVDSSTSPKTVTTNGDTKIKYTEDYRSCIFKDETGKFPYPVGSAKVDFMAIGSGVGYFDGTGDYLSIGASDDFSIDGATGILTVEMYVRVKAKTHTYPRLIQLGADNWTSGDFAITAGNNLDSKIHTHMNTGAFDFSSTTILINNTWYHVSFVKNGSSLYLFVNGSLENTATNTSSINTSSKTVYVGGITKDSQYLNGLLDNIRISKGVARYTATFNPPDDYSAPRIGKRKTNWFFFF